MIWQLRLYGALFSGGLAFAIAGCAAAQFSGSEGPPCGSVVFPPVQLLYPIPSATGVPVDLRVLVYATTPKVPRSDGSAPIALSVGATRQIPTTPTALPSPLPSPAATPYSGSNVYAVTVPKLAHAKTFGVLATIHAAGCGVQHPSFQHEVATFTTQ